MTETVSPHPYVPSLDMDAQLPGAPTTPPVFYSPFPDPRNHGEEIANIFARRKWDNAQKENMK